MFHSKKNQDKKKFTDKILLPILSVRLHMNLFHNPKNMNFFVFLQNKKALKKLIF